MKKLYYFLPLLLVFGALQAEEEAFIEPTSQPGRYQMSVARGASKEHIDFFLLDTQTGTVWKTYYGWGKYKEWKLIIPSLEQ